VKRIFFSYNPLLTSLPISHQPASISLVQERRHLEIL